MVLRRRSEILNFLSGTKLVKDELFPTRQHFEHKAFVRIDAERTRDVTR